jgi:glutathione S-transferase
VVLDLETKADWHVKMNQGFVPFLECPNGKIITDSSVIVNFAIQEAKEKKIGGIDLLPKAQE